MPPAVYDGMPVYGWTAEGDGMHVCGSVQWQRFQSGSSVGISRLLPGEESVQGAGPGPVDGRGAQRRRAR